MGVTARFIQRSGRHSTAPSTMYARHSALIFPPATLHIHVRRRPPFTGAAAFSTTAKHDTHTRIHSHAAVNNCHGPAWPQLSAHPSLLFWVCAPLRSPAAQR